MNIHLYTVNRRQHTKTVTLTTYAILPKTIFIILMIVLSITLPRIGRAATDCTQVTEIPKAECETLVTLYNNTQGPEWENNTNWNITNTPCTWIGVGCSNGHVHNLYLYANRLTGAIPVLDALTQLQYLDLSHNGLTGIIPDLGALIQLKDVYLYDNKLSGTIPDVSSLTMLQHLSLHDNDLCGHIPPSLATLTQLSVLQLANNHLSTPTDQKLIDFLNAHDSDWQNQTDNSLCSVTLTITKAGTGNGTVTAPVGLNQGIDCGKTCNENYIFGTIITLTAYPDANSAFTGWTNCSDSFTLTTHVNCIATFEALSPSLPGYASEPLAGETLNFGEVAVGKSAVAGLIVRSTGNEPLIVESNLFDGDGDFSRIAPKFPLMLNPDEKAVITLACTPSYAGLHQATVSFSTNVPDQHTVTYSLNCMGVDARTNCHEVTEIPNEECETLVTLYNNTGGEQWEDNADWNMTTIPCSWYGVGCSDGHVTHISLYENKLKGVIPDLKALTQLRYLDLRGNQLSGELSHLNGLEQLQTLYLCDNQFSGVFPDLSALRQLRELDLSYNSLNGTLSSLTHLTQLQYINLGNNQLDGNLGDINSLTQLHWLYVDSNQLDGAIPDLSNLVELESLALSNNHFKGTLPRLDTLKQLWGIYVQGNQFTGPLPDFSTLTQLIELMLSDNHLHGPFPNLSAATRLKKLYLANNQLCGDIPVWMLTLNELLELDVGDNQFILPTDTALIDFLDTRDHKGKWKKQVAQSSCFPTLTITKVGTGNGVVTAPIGLNKGIDCGKVCSENYVLGTSITLTATPDDNSIFKGWTDCSESFSLTADVNCTATFEALVPARASYSAEPAPEELIDFGDVVIGHSATANITIRSTGDKPLVLKLKALEGDNVFTVVEPDFPVMLKQEDGVVITLKCEPLEEGPYKATLELETNIHNAPDIVYPLNCMGQPPVSSVPTDCNRVVEIPKAECEALVALYHGTRGKAWKDNMNWNVTNMPCSWKGVFCDHARVQHLDLHDNALQGNVPDLSALTQLQMLNLSENQLSGILPDLSALIQLQYLNLSANQLSGALPNLAVLTQLQMLDLSENEFGGTLPDFGALVDLRYLNVGSNQLSGVIPSLDRLAQLQVLDLSSNQIEGVIPNLSVLTQLQILYLSGNRLGGTIPALDALTRLQYLYLSNNQLCGDIPLSLTTLTQLQSVALDNNHFTLPTDLGLIKVLNKWGDGWKTQSFSDTCIVRHVLTVLKTGSGAGVVTAPAGFEEGINCGGDCRETYAEGTVVDLVATADAYSTFTGWSGCSSPVTVASELACTAHFDLAPAPPPHNVEVPSYRVMPASNGTLDFGNVAVGDTATVKLMLHKSGSTPLSVDVKTLTDKNNFHIASPNFPIVVNDENKPVTIELTCTPNEVEAYAAQVVFVTNVPDSQFINYTLSCNGKKPKGK